MFGIRRPRLLDGFCCAGGAGKGYHDAGFDVVGVDINPQPHYPFEFIQADAVEVLNDRNFMSQFDAVGISPPCQKWTLAQRIQGNEHPDLITPSRQAVKALGLPYVIENVMGAPLIAPVMLCGAMFTGLRVYRHRLFESNFEIQVPDHPEHLAPLRKMGRKPEEGEFMHVVGNFTGVDYARKAMGIPWMVRNELSEAIPPAYTAYVGEALMGLLALPKAA